MSTVMTGVLSLLMRSVFIFTFVYFLDFYKKNFELALLEVLKKQQNISAVAAA